MGVREGWETKKSNSPAEVNSMIKLLITKSKIMITTGTSEKRCPTPPATTFSKRVRDIN